MMHFSLRSRRFRLLEAFLLLSLLFSMILLCSCSGTGGNQISFKNAAVTLPAAQTAAPTGEDLTVAPETTEVTIAPPAPSADETAAPTEPEPEETTEEPTAGLTEEKAEPSAATTPEEQEYVVNTNTGKFHYPDCASVKDIKSKNRSDRVCSREVLLAESFVPCKRCNP